MALHSSPRRESIRDELRPWRVETEPPLLKLTNPAPQYALIIIMAGDDDKLGDFVQKELNEIALGVHGGLEISVLVLADMAGPPHRSVYYEITGAGHNLIKERSSIDTGDPRPISAFLTAALNSLHPSTRIAIGLWGHGEGVIGDFDPIENLVPQPLRELPLGTPLTQDQLFNELRKENANSKALIFKGSCPDMDTGNILTNREISSALTVAFSRCRRTEPVDIIFFDTCFNAAAEVYGEVRRYAHTFVASSLKLPASGWDYTDFLQRTRKVLPASPKEWARLAIESCDHAYNQEFYPSPIHMVALDCQTAAFQLLRHVVEKIGEFPEKKAVQLLQQASKDLKEVGRNESLDLCLAIGSLKQATDDEELRQRCIQFLRAYQDSVIASSAPSNDGRTYTGLTVWFPRLGDVHQVQQYYQYLQFNRETNWLQLIEGLIYRPQKPSPVFLVYCFQGLKLREEQHVDRLLIDKNREAGTTLLLKISEQSAPWTTSFKEGRYDYVKTESLTFPSHQDYKKFVRVLLEIRRKEHEFETLSAAREIVVTFDQFQAKHLSRALWKYKNIIVDEFPHLLDTFEGLEGLLKQAEDDSVFVIGQGSHSYKPKPALSNMLRSADLLTRINFDLVTQSPRNFHINVESIQYYQGPLDILETWEHQSLHTGELMQVLSGLSLEELNGIYIHVHKIKNETEGEYRAIIWGDKIVPKTPPGINYQWTEWILCPECKDYLLSEGEDCPDCANPGQFLKSFLKKMTEAKPPEPKAARGFAAWAPSPNEGENDDWLSLDDG